MSLPSTAVYEACIAPPVPRKQRELRILHLALAGLVTELRDGLYHREDPAAARVAVREVAAVRVCREPAADLECPAFDEGAALALLAEPGILELHDHVDREVVADAREVDVVVGEAGLASACPENFVSKPVRLRA